jgi:tRNA-specific 2-thiouridylase
MRVLVALSGGVDSAVAAARLAREGADVVAVHYRTGAEAVDPAGAARGRSCCGADDARDARAVAARLGVAFYVVDAAEAFSERVIDDFVASYAAGRTPNPCVACNVHVKFGRLAALAKDLGAEAVATGHYARTAPRPGGGTRLLRGVDPSKDQSYVLYALDQRRLALARFPLGASTKEEVRAEARALGLRVAEKPDSQELCFLPAGDPRSFLDERAPGLRRAGDVVDVEGRVLGRHAGAAGHTVGQRRGIGVAAATPLHVARVDVEANRVVLAPRERLLARRVETEAFHFVDEDPPPASEARSWRVEARIRHGARPVPARLDVAPGSRPAVTFDEPVFAPAPGQALVAYRGDAVLGGAPIASAG